LFRKRCHASYPYAQRYVEQFPKERNAILARFVSFVAGSFAAVLVLAAVIDPDLFLHFEITPQRNTLFYIGVFGAVLAGARAMIPDERAVFEPEVLLEGVIFYTHYCPEDWKGRFHSAEVSPQWRSDEVQF
jgi:autophagy-related protein 9